MLLESAGVETKTLTFIFDIFETDKAENSWIFMLWTTSSLA
jgi:hypothetical protein